MLTRCPTCETHFRVTPEQLKARSGRVRCGQCQGVFNALDSLIEEPMALRARAAAKSAQQGLQAPVGDTAGEAGKHSEGEDEGHEADVGCAPSGVPDTPGGEPAPEPSSPAGTAEPVPDALEEQASWRNDEREPLIPAPAEVGELPAAEAEPAQPRAVRPETAETEAVQRDTVSPEAVQPSIASKDATDSGNGTETLPEPPPPPRRWPWVVGSLVALAALSVQAVLAFRVELAVLWPEAKPVLVALCSVADCDVGLPAKVALVGIEASDLHPDSEHPGRLALTATLRSRAPFAQQFPHLELTLTDTADQAIARKILAPGDYLPPRISSAQGMPPGADIMVTIGVDAAEVAASGYRLYVFYP